MNNVEVFATLVGITGAVSAGVVAFLIQDKFTWRFYQRSRAFPEDSNAFTGGLAAAGSLGFIGFSTALGFVIASWMGQELAKQASVAFDSKIAKSVGLTPQYVEIYSPTAGILTTVSAALLAFCVAYFAVLLAQSSRPEWLSQRLISDGRSSKNLCTRLIVAIPISAVVLLLTYDHAFPR